jgi:predicted N-acyltransferase
MSALEVTLHRSLSEIDGASLSRLLPAGHPIVGAAFLGLMEQTGVLRAQGWQALHLALHEAGSCIGLLPLYVKQDSIGEFSEDWQWAQAWQRAGQPYYPKLVTCIPFTPVTGPRLLLGAIEDAAHAVRARQLAAAAAAQVARLGCSSWHLLFPTEREAAALADLPGLHGRLGVQFHWFNRGYGDFEDFLATLSSRRRKEIRRERRQAQASGLEFVCLDGHSAEEQDWRDFHRFYCSTFERKWGEPRFNLAWFRGLAAAEPGRTLLFLARSGGRPVAGAFALRDGDTLYGRHWGCDAFHPQLHFELCYYRTIDYCIGHGLARLDAGTQGEHKLTRGFEPILTRSLHHVRDPRFRPAIDDFCRREARAALDYLEAARRHLPYREAPEPVAG